MFELLEEVVGINDAGEVCHPFTGVLGGKTGLFSYTMLSDNTTFKGINAASLRRKIEAGEFNYKGRIRMIPKRAISTSHAGALRVVSYMGKKLPIWA